MQAKKFSRIQCFDLDHTLIKENCASRFAIYCYQNKFLSFSKLFYVARQYCSFSLGITSSTTMHQKNFNAIYLGISAPLLQSLAKTFINENFEKLINPVAVKALKNAQKKGDYTVILSSSPRFLVQPFAERFGVNECNSAHYNRDNKQYFSAISHFMEGKDKAQYLTFLAQRLGIERQGITAYSDSDIDLPFLEAAGTAIGVNPNRRLRKICIKNKWQIL